MRATPGVRFALWACLVFAQAPIAAGEQGPPASPAPDAAPPVALTADARLERPLASPGEHVYEVQLAAGDFFEVSVTQDRLKANLHADGPEGTRRHDLQMEIDPLAQRLMFIADQPGVYRLRVASPRDVPRFPADRPGPAGYVLQVRALRAATPDDEARARVFAEVEAAGADVRQQSLDGIKAALARLRGAAAGWRALGDLDLEAMTLEALASMSGLFGQFRLDSIAARERLTTIWRERGRADLERWNLQALAQEYADDARWEAATEAGLRMVALARADGAHGPEASALASVALGNLRLGRFEPAREYAAAALERVSLRPAPVIEGRIYWLQGQLAEAAGDLDVALEHYRRALSLVGASRLRGNLLNNLGFLHLRRGEVDEAEPQFAARLAMDRNIQREQEGLARVGLGEVKRARGDRAGAREAYLAAAALMARGQVVWARCVAESRLGTLDLDEGDLEAAKARFEQVLELAAQGAYPSCEAEGRAGLAETALRRGDLGVAEAHARRAVELADGFREAAVSLESRALGFGALASAYELAIDVELRLADRGDRARHVARALELNERSLARALVDGLSGDRESAAARVPAGLARERRDVHDAWRARVIELEGAIRRGPPERRDRLREDVAVLAVRLRQIEERIDGADARHAGFVRPRALDVATLQRLLDDGTVLLEYGLGRTRSVVWVVSAQSVDAFALPPRAEIEALARRVHRSLAGPPDAARAGRIQADIEALSRMVLPPAPLDAPRLVVVGPEALALVPFGVLSATAGPGRPGAALVARHEMIHLPSATVLAALRGGRDRPRPTRNVAIFADPVYDATDPRVGPPVSRVAGRAPSTTRDAGPVDAEVPSGWAGDRGGAGGASLARLPFSREEADAIAALAPRSSLRLLGLDATRARARSAEISEFRIIHFAAHGLVQPDVPNASGIALSLVDAKGSPLDGFLLLPDVYELKLNADLVVLSACRTALGNVVHGEGQVGLTRGFLFAGAGAVVSSLWRVDDEATAALMTAFYRGMLREGRSPSAALRAAQLAVRRTPRWRAPYYWAGFVLHGDWRRGVGSPPDAR